MSILGLQELQRYSFIESLPHENDEVLRGLSRSGRD